MTTELVFADVMVPKENVVGRLNQATIRMMRNLEIERIALTLISLVIAKRCAEEFNSYFHHFKAFGKEIFLFGQVKNYFPES